jgi:hypothetical protein
VAACGFRKRVAFLRHGCGLIAISQTPLEVSRYLTVRSLIRAGHAQKANISLDPLYIN